MLGTGNSELKFGYPSGAYARGRERGGVWELIGVERSDWRLTESEASCWVTPEELEPAEHGLKPVYLSLTSAGWKDAYCTTNADLLHRDCFH